MDTLSLEVMPLERDMGLGENVTHSFVLLNFVHVNRFSIKIINKIMTIKGEKYASMLSNDSGKLVSSSGGKEDSPLPLHTHIRSWKLNTGTTAGTIITHITCTHVCFCQTITGTAQNQMSSHGPGPAWRGNGVSL